MKDKMLKCSSRWTPIKVGAILEGEDRGQLVINILQEPWRKHKKQQVCQWKCSSRWYYNPHEVRSITNTSNKGEYKYCPDCGKKIKYTKENEG